MKFIVITQDAEIEEAARKGLHPDDTTEFYSDWHSGLEACTEVDLLFVDMLATLEEPNKIAGYETFAMAKMRHMKAKDVKLVLISPPQEYELDFMAGWPNFVFLHYRRPVDYKIFRRASTWV
jgi:hypothetical protein